MYSFYSVTNFDLLLALFIVDQQVNISTIFSLKIIDNGLFIVEKLKRNKKKFNFTIEKAIFKHHIYTHFSV